MIFFLKLLRPKVTNTIFFMAHGTTDKHITLLADFKLSPQLLVELEDIV